MQNPFKFGSVVEDEYFINRKSEIAKVRNVLKSANHLIIISPRRYGKTSLINKVSKELGRPYIFLDLQLTTTQTDLASQFLKKVYKKFPAQKIKSMLRNFRIAPLITLNPVTNEIDITYKASSAQSAQTYLEDVMNIVDKLGTGKKKPIIIFDEFQEIKKIGPDTDRMMRSIIQHHKNVNYVFLGSQESLLRDIFTKKKSPFYHFGYMMPLDKIPYDDFSLFLKTNFKEVTTRYENVSLSILEITNCHPYYTQQLAFETWEILLKDKTEATPVEKSVNELIRHHDIDYERLWNTINRTDMKILIGMSDSKSSPLSAEFINRFDTGASSTVYSSLKRMMQNGYIVKYRNSYEIDDPFFKAWIRFRRLK